MFTRCYAYFVTKAMHLQTYHATCDIVYTARVINTVSCSQMR
ncbi:hypothetical protein SAMN04489764_3780 [Thermostaphylospora chromogena]|uniref:Uncharacterized protein n=1 Tax=Thermostaphylospora chromogena TaxID=35622 RepID=A0A1H1GSS2_9ACTN|nr:hypothetical protein SAMN04489764_3780 [Thermostaphylospora chromogena]